MKRKIAVFLALAVIAASVFTGTVFVSAAEVGSIPLTVVGLGDGTVYTDSENRIWLDLVTEEDVTVTNNDVRTGSATCFPTININGEDFTFSQTTIASYLASFAQVFDNGRMHVLLKHASGQGATGNASFYPEDYPGIPEGQDNVIKFYKGTVIGAYVFANDFEVHISAEREFMLLSDPHAVTVVNGAAVENVYETGGEQVASAGASVRLQAEEKAGYRVTGVSVKDEAGETVDAEVTEEGNGYWTLKMPAEDITVTFLYEEVSYILTAGQEQIEVFPGKAIGALPAGRWAVDGCEISDESIWIWEENKTAGSLPAAEEVYAVTFKDGDRVVSVQYYSLTNKNITVPRISSASDGYSVAWEPFTLDGGDKTVHTVWAPKEYTAVFMADGETVAAVTFTADSETLELPPVPYKEGYTIVGWDITEFPKGDVTIRAIYQKAE